MSRRLLLLCCALLWVGGSGWARQGTPERFRDAGRRAREAPVSATAAAARAGEERALEYLVRVQHPDGSYASGATEGLLDSGYSVASYHDWQMGAHALALLALAAGRETGARAGALERGMEWYLTTRRPRRGSDWDNDTIWAALYGVVATATLVKDPRFSAPAWQARIEQRGREFLDLLIRNQIPTGGWGYYDDPPYSRRPKWGTSFATALVIPALGEAERLGWLDDPRVRKRAVAYVRRCALPNGAYEYDLNPIPRVPAGASINQVKGSLGRIQVCNWALFEARSRRVTEETLRTGLERFFRFHKFLDIARMRPVPHEAYYANAGYFYYFGQYYAARVINLLPQTEREAWHARLRPQILKTQRVDGSMCDFVGQRYMVVADTALGALTLQAGLGGKP